LNIIYGNNNYNKKKFQSTSFTNNTFRL